MPVHRRRESLTSKSPLEVKTDAPMPPSVAIVSPTPRAFTFSNILDGPTPRAFSFPTNVQCTPPEASPSTPSTSPSPFEPDLSSLSISQHYRRRSESQQRNESPIPINPFSPFETIAASSGPISVAHRRRGSTASSVSVERKPKRGDEDYIKRPENAFILFRRECCLKKNAEEAASAQAGGEAQRRQRQADLSKTISQQWRSLSAEERKYWDDLAKQRKKEHEEMYPWYVYQPTRSKEKGKQPKSKSRSGRSRGASSSSVASSASSISTADSEDFGDYSDSEASSYVPQPSRRSISVDTPPPGYPPAIKLPTLLGPLQRPESAHEFEKQQHESMVHAQDLYQQFMPPPPSESAHVPTYHHHAMDFTGQLPDYSADLHNNQLFHTTNVFEQPSNVQLEKPSARPLTQLSIPPTQPQNPSFSHQLSPTHSLSSPGSVPVTPHRMLYNNQLQLPAEKQRPLNLPESPKAHGWDAFDLPAWAMSTLYAGVPNGAGHAGAGAGMGVNTGFGAMEGDFDMSSMSAIPPFTLDLPGTHQGEGGMEGEHVMDPLFGLQFRFEDLLDPSQL